MGRSAKILCAVMAALLLASGCSTQTYTPSTDDATREIKIKAGDRIRVVTTRRERLAFDVTEVRPDRFVGVTTEFQYHKDSPPGGETVEVPFDELALLQVTRFDTRPATIAAAVVVVTLSAIGAVIGAVALPVVPPVVP